MWIHTVKLREFHETGSGKGRLQLADLSPGMMPLFWVTLWSVLPPLVFLSGPDICKTHDGSSSQKVSPLLESLQCHNDYESYVECKWTRTDTPLQLWLQQGNTREQCDPFQHTDEHRTDQCRYKAPFFAIGVKHTAYFLKNITHCSSGPTHLSQHLRSRPPVDLSTHDAGDGGRWLKWSSPYPSPSPLSKNLQYQLSYRPQSHSNFTIKDVTSTEMKLEKLSLLPGRIYEARVRARASVGQWSDWSPTVTWQTEEDAEQFPRLHCVLEGEKEVTCSWEVSREQAHFITYQLACGRSRTAPFDERCCVNPTVTPDLSRSVLSYSCSLAVADPAHLLLKLMKTRNVKTFEAYQHIRPKPPQQVTVKGKDGNWIVEWTKPSTASKVDLYYQVCYNSTQNSSTLKKISGSMSLTILDASLAPSHNYEVRVRSVVAPGMGSTYKGIPSEWSEPVRWTSHEATWSFTNLIYVFTSAMVVIVFFTFYFTIPACRRKVVLWVESVPSPGKSKILSEIKSASNQSLMQSENTYICKVLSLDSLSTCSSDASLWPSKDTEKQHLEQYSGCWSCDDPAEKLNGNDLSSMSFSGPYIFCKTSESNCKSAEDACEEKEEQKEETSLDDAASPSPLTFALFGDGYVCLPNRGVSRSTQDLVSHSEASTRRHDGAEADQQCPDNTAKSDKAELSEPAGGHQPSPYTSGPLTPWPQGGTVQASGYCLLPQNLS